MTTPEKKTDVLNIRMDPALAGEIQRLADWRGKSASEVARDLIRHGITVERQVQAQELRRPYEHSNIERDPNMGHLKIEAEWIWYTPRELAEIEAERDEWMSMP